MDEENIDNLESLSEYRVYHTILEWESDDKKIEAMEKYITNLQYKVNIIKSLSLAENKVRLLKEIKDSILNVREIVSSIIFENDEQRIKIARLLEDDDLIYEILKKIEDDEKKIETIILLSNNYYKTNLVCSFKSDEYKIKAIKEHIDDKYDRISIIKRLSTNESILKNLYLLDFDGKKEVLRSLVFDNDEEIIRIASSLEDEDLAYIIVIKIENDDKKIEAMKLFKDEENIAFIIKTIKDDAKKIEQLEKVRSEEYKVIIISSLSNDEIMLEQLEKIRDEKNKVEIINSLKSDELKIKQLEKIKYEENKAEIITSLESDELKVKQLDNIVEDNNKAKIICSFNKDENKIPYIDKFKREDIKARIISSMNNPILKADLLDKISDDYHKANIIISMASNAKFKIKQMEKLDDEFAKAMVIKSLYGDRIKIQQLSNISNDYCRMVIIESLNNRNEKIKLVESLNDEFLKELLIEVLNSEQYDEKTGFPCVRRSKLKEKFLDENRKYTEIGLDKKMTIGMEIESEGPLSSIMLVLKKIAISEKEGSLRGWETKDDGSLYDGVEVVSPILSDNKEDIEDIYMICSMLKNGQRASKRCGGHIHIGADYLTSKEAYINLFEIWGNTEKIIYQMCNENGEIPRDGIQEYAPPISPKLNEALEKGTINLEDEEDINKFIEKIQNVQGDRYSGLNLLNINNGKNTIEFRIPNGTINPDVWIENARLFGRIVQMSQRLAEIEKQTEISKEDEHLIELYDALKQDISEGQKMEILLELLFTEEERHVYRERYNKCARRIKKMTDGENPLKHTKFSSVNFKKKHSKDEFHDVAVKNRSGSENEVVNETKRGIAGEPDINKNKENTEDY